MPTAHLTLVAHTHWDREWYEPFEVFRTQLLGMLDEALDRLEADPRLSFTLDGQMAMVDDYLELRPDAAPRIRRLVEAGRLHVGPWFTAADTLLSDGEGLLRNLCLGIRHGDALGGAMRLGYMPDQFGHAAQVPQLLRSVGIDSAAIWRGVGKERPPHAFRWIAPDGSEVKTLWLQDGYASGRRLPSDAPGFAEAVGRTIDRLAPWLGDLPLLIPVGDDHVRIASWLPAAADALRARYPNLSVSIGAFPEHVGYVGAIDHAVHGELRSPAFAPVLAGVASARSREKQAQAHATTLLVRYAEPLAAWLAAVGTPAQLTLPRQLIDRAWRHLLHNQAHDSAAGCGSDATHEDVRARSRWAEQLGRAARDHALAALSSSVAAPAGGGPAWLAFHPGPAAPSLQVEIDVPRALEGPLAAIGPDGVARPLQSLELGAPGADAPLFEGEFAAAELAMYLGGLDPTTPLFGRYLTGITVRPDGERRMRLDVGLGEAPVAPAKLAADQRRVSALLDQADRFRVVLHGAGSTRRMLATVGPAGEAALVPFAVRSAAAAAPAEGASASERTLASGSLRVTVLEDGAVAISDARHPELVVRAHELEDDADRGDLYHFDRVAGPPLRPGLLGVELTERGPARARLRIRQQIDLPLGLAPDRAGRASALRTTAITTEVTVFAGERRVEFRVSFDNESRDHRLRAVAHLPFAAARIDAEHCLAVVRRPIDVATLGAGVERAAPTGQHHHFVDVTDGVRGVALLSRGLPEHEVISEQGGSARLALTLSRSVGWLARGDLACVDHAAGPMVPTPGAQELGPHLLEYALLLHDGDWRAGEVHADARRYAAPPISIGLGEGVTPEAPPRSAGGPLVELSPAQVVLSAAHPAERGGLVVRLLNASPDPVRASLSFPFSVAEVTPIDPLQRPLRDAAAPIGDGKRWLLPLRPWQLATLHVRRP